jgi:hypothetical protein
VRLYCAIAVFRQLPINQYDIPTANLKEACPFGGQRFVWIANLSNLHPVSFATNKHSLLQMEAVLLTLRT